MQVSVEKLSPVVVEFSVQVPATRVKTEVERAYGTLQRTAHIRGYRPGKAPKQVLMHLFSGRVHSDVAKRLMDETLMLALKEKSVEPLTQPAISPGELSPDQEFSYKARFEVKPDLEKVNWQGLAVKRPAAAVESGAVDAELERLRREHATEEPPAAERPAKTGDIVGIGFTLFVTDAAGEEKEATKGEQTAQTELGQGQLMPELEQAAIGMSVGETKDVSVTFPEQHSNAELRGKTGKFKLSLKSVKERVLPTLDDEFAKDCGEFENLGALKKDIETKLEKAAKNRQTEVVAQQIVQELCKANPIAVPPSLIERQATMTERELLMAARRAGQRLDPSVDWRATVRADAEMKVRAGLLMAEVAKEKAITITDEDIEKGYKELAEEAGKNINKIKAEYRDPQKQEMLRAMILEDKILDLLEGAATISDA